MKKSKYVSADTAVPRKKTAADSPERKLEKEALRTSETRFRALFEQAAVGVAEIDAMTGRFIRVNQRYADIIGLTIEATQSTSFQTITHPDDLQADLDNLALLRNGKIREFTLEKRYLRKDGTIVWVNLTVSPLWAPAEAPTRNIAVVTDISERKRAEAQRDLLAAAIESAIDAIVITATPRGTIQYVNKAFELLTGYSREEAIGKNLHFLESGRHDARFYQELREHLNRNGVWTGQLINKKKDGTLYYEACTYFVFKGVGGDIMNYFSIKRDVTEKLRLEAIAESVAAMDNIGYIFSGIRHEIGDPISTLLIILELLQAKLETSPKEVVRKYVNQALDQVSKVEYLLKSLKNFNMFEAMELRSVRVTTFFDKFLSLVSEDFSARGIVIDAAVAEDADWVNADIRALQQVMLNIFTNAADALQGASKPKITVRVSKAAKMVIIQVADNGGGMTVDQQRNLFLPFHTNKPSGTGLGMVIIKKMLSKMNGFVEVQSQLGVGTTVDVFLPKGAQ